METDSWVRKVLEASLDVLLPESISINLLSTNCAKMQTGFIHFSESKMNEPRYCPFGVHNLVGSQVL